MGNETNMKDYGIGQGITEGDLVSEYGDALVQTAEGARHIPLLAALAFEGQYCTSGQRKDPSKRVAKLAAMLDAAGSLREEHRNLLSKKEA